MIALIMITIFLCINNFYALYKLSENQKEYLIVQNVTKIVNYPKILRTFHINKTYQNSTEGNWTYNCVNFTNGIYEEFMKINITAIPMTGVSKNENKSSHRAIAIIFEPQTGKPYMMGKYDLWRISGESKYWNFSNEK